MTSRSRKKSQLSPFLYRSLASYLREIFGFPIRKVPVDPGFGCPNRDGTLGNAGCSFCVPASFVPPHARFGESPVDQIRRARKGKQFVPFIVYIQAGTGTYAPLPVFSRMVDEICRIPGVAGLFVGTRPDCVDDGVLDVMERWRGRRLVWLEMGLQSSSDRTLARIGRGHGVDAFVTARDLARERDIPVCAHVILGLPGEGTEEMMATAAFLAEHDVEGVKIHHLQVIRGAGIEDEYNRGEITPIGFADYPAMVADFLEGLPSRTVVHRLMADAPDDMLIAPRWPDKEDVIRAIREELIARESFQGKALLTATRQLVSPPVRHA